MPAPDHEHPRHPGVPARWHPLHPSFPSGTAYHCTVPVGTRPDGLVAICGEGYTEPTARCQCAPGNHGVVPTGLPFQPFRARRTIWRGVCSECGLIVPGHEDEADADPDNW